MKKYSYCKYARYNRRAISRTTYALMYKGDQIATGWTNDEKEIQKTVALLNSDRQDRREHRQGVLNKILTLGGLIATRKIAGK